MERSDNPNRQVELDERPRNGAIMRGLRPKLVMLLSCIAMLCLGGPSALGAADEYSLKAAFVFNFVQFVEWPSGAFSHPKAPLEIGILGQDPFNGAMDRAMAGKTVNGHPLIVRHYPTVNDIQGCHVLYVPAASQEQFPAAQQKLSGNSVLTIGEPEGFTDGGGVIRLYTEGKFIKFDVNRGTADRTGSTSAPSS